LKKFVFSQSALFGHSHFDKKQLEYVSVAWVLQNSKIRHRKHVAGELENVNYSKIIYLFFDWVSAKHTIVKNLMFTQNTARKKNACKKPTKTFSNSNIGRKATAVNWIKVLVF